MRPLTPELTKPETVHTYAVGMSQSPGPAVSKVANVVIATAEPTPTVGAMPGTRQVTERYANRDGGLWVGGRVTLSDTTISFIPNAMNRAVHANSSALGLTLPLAEVLLVDVVGRLPIKTVNVGTADQLMQIRCYGAKKFAELIRERIRVRPAT